MGRQQDDASALVPGEFEDLLSAERRRLALVAVREVGMADAEDVVQEALIRAWRRRSTFDPQRGTFRAWLVTILLDQCRRHRSRSRRVQLARDEAVDGPDGARLDLERAVRSLPQRQRQVVTLHYLADLSVDEIASVLEISSGTVKSTLSDARRALRERLEPR